MAFPNTTYTTNSAAASGLVNSSAAAGLDISGLQPLAQLQSAVANLLVSDPTTVNIPAGDILSGTFGANKSGGADTGIYSFPGAITSAGGIMVNTNKFVVAAATGNVTIAGTLGVTGATTLSAALVVNAASQLGTAAGADVTTIGGTAYGAGVASLRLNGLTTAAVSDQVGTLTNAPAAGNPTFWIPVSIAGVVKYIPAW